MELIYKKDAIHAVLHNQGDAAVAAVENIDPICTAKILRELGLFDELRELGSRLVELKEQYGYEYAYGYALGYLGAKCGIDDLKHRVETIIHNGGVFDEQQP